MNVFKLLSRSSKVPAPSSVQKLPSSGAVANPQLFGHDEPTQSPQAPAKNRKRKRAQHVKRTETDEPAPLPAELDFFGASVGGADDEGCGNGLATQEKKKQRRLTRRDTETETAGQDTEAETGDGQEPEVFDEEEAKRILRSHKLKVHVLEDFAPPVTEHLKEKNKSKKRAKEEAALNKKKEAKRQLHPQPLTSFAQLRTRYAISRRLAENIMEQGYKVPTEVQLGALPLLLARKSAPSCEDVSGAQFAGDIDLLTVAPTGSGKTIAFLIPIIDALLAHGKATDGEEGPRAVILAPTRELASQIVNEARKLAKGTAIKATLMRKGMEVVQRLETNSDDQDIGEGKDSDSDSEDGEDMVPQQKDMTRQADLVKAAILVATPLALLNSLKRKDGTVAAMPAVSRLVLDEADVLLDPLFRDQTLAIWNACTKPSLRIGLWSATMGSSIEALALSTLNARWSFLTAAQPTACPRRPPLIRLVVGLKDSAVPNLSHQLVYAATESGKLLGLRQLLHPTSSSSPSTSTLQPPFLVFTQTIPRAIALHSELLYDIPPEAGGSSRIAVLHADLSSSARDAIMTRFRRGEIWVLITTDLLARGVDFRGLNGVVNYDVPTSAAAYVHRVGRTGRAGRTGGVAVTYYTQEDIPYVKLLANVIRASEKLRNVADQDSCVKQWLLDALPTPSKRDRQQLKKRGVEARRTVKKTTDTGGRAGTTTTTTSRISTKSGYVRKMENNRRGAMLASKRRGREDGEPGSRAESDEEFEGFA